MSQGRMFTVRRRIRYGLDNVFARGILPVFLLIQLGLVLVLCIAATIQTVFRWGPSDSATDFPEAFWLSLTRTLDGGTMGDDTGVRFRIVSLIITMVGILALTVLIGLISHAIDARIYSLDQGRSVVVEREHTLILGWSLKVPVIVGELVQANASKRRATIVLLNQMPKSEVQHLLRQEVRDFQTTRVVIRTGNPSKLHDLEAVNPAWAGSVIVVADDHSQGDSDTIKAVLGVLKECQEGGSNEGRDLLPVVVEVFNKVVADALMAATNSAAQVGGTASSRSSRTGEGRGALVRAIASSEVVGRLAAHATLRAGMSAVYEELLDFAGSEMYFDKCPELLVGRTYGEALVSYRYACPIGLERADKRVQMNPPMEAVLECHDHLLVIAKDDKDIGRCERPDVSEVATAQHKKRPPTGPHFDQTKTLIIGWSDFVPMIAEEIDEMVATDSVLDIVVDKELVDDDSRTLDISRQRVSEIPVDAYALDALCEVVNAKDYDHVLLLCDRKTLTPNEADARVLLNLMAIRNSLETSEGRPERSPNLVTEVLQLEDRLLVDTCNPDDFLVSDRLMSLAMAQICQEPMLYEVFRSLLHRTDVVLQLRPWTDYLDPTGNRAAREVTFEDVVEAARGHGESAIGVRCKQDAEGRDLTSNEPELVKSSIGHVGGGILINPSKDQELRFEEGDQFVVLTSCGTSRQEDQAKVPSARGVDDDSLSASRA